MLLIIVLIIKFYFDFQLVNRDSIKNETEIAFGVNRQVEVPVATPKND